MTSPIGECYRCKQPVSPRGKCGCADGVCLICADCEKVLPHIEGITAVVTDPPYALSFMGKQWDSSIPDIWEPLLRCCLPGAHCLAFGAPRTHHRLMCAIEDAGWKIRDCLMWIFGSGFPKSLDVSKALDKAAGMEREVIGSDERFINQKVAIGGKAAYGGVTENRREFTAPATDAAKTWDGWGTALKPSYEPIVLARKPLDGTVAANCLEHGCGALNVEGCRVELTQYDHDEYIPNRVGYKDGIEHKQTSSKGSWFSPEEYKDKPNQVIKPSGRWPANLIHDGSEQVVEGFPVTHAPVTSGGGTHFAQGRPKNTPSRSPSFTDSGSAARFFYCAKASKAERGKGCDHPTVKPLDLMSYLCKLVCSPSYTGVLLDPFAGSGSTLLAASRWHERVIGIEREEKYCKIAAERLRQEELFT